MRITVVSRSWPSHERSGVTLAASEHVRLLADARYDVSIIGSDEAVAQSDLPVCFRVYVPAQGSGSLYAPARVDRARLELALHRISPGLVIGEAWQTALTDAAMEVAAGLGIPTLMISHGSSLHPFTLRALDVLRACAWAPYRRFTLPRLISRLSVLTTLDESSNSRRFHDRQLARRIGVPVMPLVNCPVNWTEHFVGRESRKPQELVVGYYSPIKNQLLALDVAARLPSSLRFLFIGPRRGRYFARCVRRAAQLGLTTRVTFAEDHECSIADEVSRSMAVLSTSVTEVLPLTLIEAMASGTPFAATPVGAVPSLRGGVHADNAEGLAEALRSLVAEPLCWQACSAEGRRQHVERYSRARVRNQLLAAVDAALREGPPCDRFRRRERDTRTRSSCRRDSR